MGTERSKFRRPSRPDENRAQTEMRILVSAHPHDSSDSLKPSFYRMDELNGFCLKHLELLMAILATPGGGHTCFRDMGSSLTRLS